MTVVLEPRRPGRKRRAARPAAPPATAAETAPAAIKARKRRRPRPQSTSPMQVPSATPDLMAALTVPPAAAGWPVTRDITEPLMLPPSGGHHPANARTTHHVQEVDHPPVWRDARGFVRAPATMPGAGKGRAPKSKGQTYPRNPPTSGECVRLINGCPDTPAGHRLRAFIILAWRTGLRISEVLALVREDLDEVTGSVTVKSGKGGKRRVVGMDTWGWQQLKPWLGERRNYPAGPVFCVLEGPTAGRGWNSSQVRLELHRLARQEGITKRIAPHQLRHAFAAERKREGADLFVLKQQLGHVKMDTTYHYIGDLSPDEVLDAARVRPTPTVLITDVLEGVVADV